MGLMIDDGLFSQFISKESPFKFVCSKSSTVAGRRRPVLY